MKYLKTAGLVVLGIIVGVIVTYLACTQLLTKTENDANKDEFAKSGHQILPFKEEYLIGNKGDENLYVEFDDRYLTIKEGEEFQYKKAVKSTNGEFAENNNAVQYELKEGKYVVSYKISDKQDASIKREYVKLLTVTK